MLLFSYLSVSSVTVGIIFNAWGLVWKLLEAYKLMSLRKEALLSAHSKTVKKFVWMFKKHCIYFNFFLSSGFIYISVLYVRQAKIRDLRCDVRASPTKVS